MNQSILTRYLKLMSWIAALLPTKWAYPAATFVARHFNPRETELVTVKSEISKALPQLSAKEVAEATTSYINNMGIAALNTYLFSNMKPSRSKKNIMINGLETLDKAINPNKGLLILSAHQHHLVFLATALGLHGIKINPILLNPKLTVPDYLTEYMDTMIKDSEALFNGGKYLIVDLDKQYVRNIYRLLDDKQIIFAATDFPNNLAPKRRIIKSMFNQSVSIPYGSIKIALERDVPMVTAFLEWQGKDQFTIHIRPILESTLENICGEYVSHLEQHILQNIGSWEGWKWGNVFLPEGVEKE